MSRPIPRRSQTRFARMRRQLGFDRNELRRGIDRTQWKAGIALFLVFLVTGPLGVSWATATAFDAGVRTELRERRPLHQVTATVLSGQDAKASSFRYGKQTERASWREQDGTTRTAEIPSWLGAGPGDTRRVWVDASAKPTRPRPRAQTVADASMIGAGTAVTIAVALLGGYLLFRRRCDRLRYGLWDADWARLDSKNTR